MADRPILFSAPMVRAILREIEQPGTGKTQTRRVLSPQPEPDMSLVGMYAPTPDSGVRLHDPGDADRRIPLRYMPDDRLYVREAWRSEEAYDDLPPASMGSEEPIRYEADGSHQSWGYPAISKLGRFRQGMHMPRWASRITLIVTDVRVQRLQEITDSDGYAEGISRDHLESIHGPDGFRDLWNGLNADRGHGWDANPWIAAYTFSPIAGNIDQIEPGRPQSNRAGAAW